MAKRSTLPLRPAARRSYREIFHFPVWRVLAQWLKALGDPRILEVGCADGLLAEYLTALGFTHYRGFDISPELVTKAQVIPLSFSVADATDIKTYLDRYDVVVCTEVYEHMEQDLIAISNIPVGVPLYFSVPTFPHRGHVRHFPTPQHIIDRYGKLLRFSEIAPFSRSKRRSRITWHLCKSVRICREIAQAPDHPE